MRAVRLLHYIFHEFLTLTRFTEQYKLQTSSLSPFISIVNLHISTRHLYQASASPRAIERYWIRTKEPTVHLVSSATQDNQAFN